MFWWNKFAKLSCINLLNRRLKTITYGRQKSADSDSDELGEKCADSDPNSESVTTLDRSAV